VTGDYGSLSIAHQLLGTVIDQLRLLQGMGELSESETKEIDSAVRLLRLVLYSRERAATPGHAAWLKSVGRQRAAGAPDDEAGLGREDLERLASGR
jgi:hypothetical protein